MTKTKKYFKPKVFGMPKPLWNLIRWIFILSGTVMTITATLRGSAAAGLAGVALSFAFYCWLFLYKGVLDGAVRAFSPVCGITALPFAAAAARIYMGYFYFRFEKLSEGAVGLLARVFPAAAGTARAMIPHAKTLMTVMTGIALWLVFYWMANGLRIYAPPFIRSLNGTEIALLVTGVVVSMALIFIVYSRTNLFYLPARDGHIVLYDAVFTSDSGILMETNAFANLNAGENDLRHPLFGLFSMPVGIVASWIAYCFRSHELAYVLSLSFLQVLALLLAMVLVSRLAGLRHLDQIAFLLLYYISFPSMLFLLTIEQYIMALFWLMLYLYAVTAGKGASGPWLGICFAGASGSLLTSGFFIFFSPREGGWKQGLLTILKTGLAFCAFVAAFGQLPLFTGAVPALRRLSRFAAAGLPFMEKLQLYLKFVADCLLAPGGAASHAYAHASYQLPAPEGLSRVGIALLVLALAGFALNYKNKFCLMSLSWVLFSFCLLCLAGWGAEENGMILYSLYFSWAFLALIFAGLTKALAKHPFIRFGLAAAAFLVVAAVNIQELRELIRFGFFYYPN
ncbi:MAG: hypothetical protein FWG28_06570 [Clostridiales bacterium]|nr:hypothetical protein [Clostridiales bacterium]